MSELYDMTFYLFFTHLVLCYEILFCHIFSVHGHKTIFCFRIVLYQVTIGQLVHQECRLTFYNKSKKKDPITATEAVSLAVTQDHTPICFFCGQSAKLNHKTKKG